MVKKYIDGKLCENFENYFVKSVHGRVKCNNGYFLKVPKVILEFSKHGFYFQGIKLLSINCFTRQNIFYILLS